MSLRSILSGLIKDPAKHFIYEKIPPERTTFKVDKIEPLVPEQCYFRVKLIQMFLGYRRQYWMTRSPIVHAFPRFLSGSGTNEIPVVIGPNKLKDLDSRNLDKVISLNQTIIGELPYIGDDLELLIALFASRTNNYATQFFNLATSLSDLVPNMGIETSLKFLKPMESGISNLLNQNELVLKIGVQDTFSSITGGDEVVNPLQSGYRCVIATESSQIDVETLWLTDRGLTEGKDGELLKKCDYFVFKIENIPSRDWCEVKPLLDAWNDVKKLVVKRDNDAIEKKFDEFTTMVITSSDLIEKDAYDAVYSCREKLDKMKKFANIGTKGITSKEITIPTVETVPTMMDTSLDLEKNKTIPLDIVNEFKDGIEKPLSPSLQRLLKPQASKLFNKEKRKR